MSETDSQDKSTKCYKHPDVEAVGACLACGKPLCETCGEWFRGRYYCPSCYGTVEIMHAQAEIPNLKNTSWFHSPQNIIAFIFVAYCFLFMGFLYYSMNRISLGISLTVIGFILLVGNILLVQTSPGFTAPIRFIFKGFLYLSLLGVVSVIIIVGLINKGIIHLF